MMLGNMFLKWKKSSSITVFCLCACFLPVTCLASGIDIECIPVKFCPMAMQLIKTKPRTSATISFLRSAHCGFDGKDAMVWCTKFKYCTTPDSKNGTCTPVKECEPYLKMLQTLDTSDPVTKKYLREFRCTTEYDPNIRVCCPQDKSIKLDRPPVSTIPPTLFTPTYKKNPEDNLVKDRFADPVLELCGKHTDDDRIFGGSEASLGEFPWLALLKYKDGDKEAYGCTGSLVNARYILTAAHCLDPYIIKAKKLGNLYSIVLGEHDLTSDPDCIRTNYGEDCANPIREVGIESTIIHPEYYQVKVTNDVALIRLDEHIVYTDYIRPICLSDKAMTFGGNEIFSIAGWGKTETARRSSTKLKALVPYRNKVYCNNVSGQLLSEGQMCAGYGNGTDNCFGDSGGPLMLQKPVNGDLITIIVGIISYGYGGTCGEYPSVYTYVPYYVDWIHRIIT